LTALLCGYGVGTMTEVEVKNLCMECGDGVGEYRCNDCESHLKTCEVCSTDIDTRHIPTGICLSCDKFICEECFIAVEFAGEDKLCLECSEEPVPDTPCVECYGSFDPKCTTLEFWRDEYVGFCSAKCAHIHEYPECIGWSPDKYNQISTDKVESLCNSCKKQYEDYEHGPAAPIWEED